MLVPLAIGYLIHSGLVALNLMVVLVHGDGIDTLRNVQAQ